MSKKIFNKVKWLRTHEEWWGTFEPLCVYPNLEYCNPENYPAMRCTVSNINGWHVSVWGDDDFGLDIWDIDQVTACAIYDNIVDYTCQAEMKKMGLDIV